MVCGLPSTTRLKKKAAPYFELMNKENKLFESFSVEVIWKIFEFSFILKLSQLCKEKHYFAKIHFFHRDCETEICNVFAQTNAIFKQKKIAIPD